MKIDTLNLETRAPLSRETLRLLRATDHHTYYKENGSRYVCYSYTLQGYPCRVMIFYTEQNQRLRINIPSLPKLITGSSLIPLDDSSRDEVFSAISDCLGSIGIHEVDPISEWNVRRMDTYHDFQLGDKVSSYLAALSNTQIARYTTISVLGESVNFKCDSKEHYCYNKQKKLLTERGYTQEDVERSAGIMRYEVRHKAGDLNRDNRVPSLKFGEICTDEVTGALVEKYFNTLPIANLSVSTATEIQKKLAEFYGTSTVFRLMGFIDAYRRNAIDEINPRTKIRYMDQLRAVGVSPIIGIEDLPPLILPFASSPPSTLTSSTEPQTTANTEYRRRPSNRRTARDRDITQE
ncbi:hypothetical protein [Paenibacillus sp. NPDC057934]|uniref:hypothetical protein n=1 Tax=Paenibacillus sp. NPDC057934 TaxID=3346282 RepID=UPI0036DB5C8B